MKAGERAKSQSTRAADNQDRRVGEGYTHKRQRTIPTNIDYRAILGSTVIGFHCDQAREKRSPESVSKWGVIRKRGVRVVVDHTCCMKINFEPIRAGYIEIYIPVQNYHLQTIV